MFYLPVNPLNNVTRKGDLYFTPTGKWQPVSDDCLNMEIDNIAVIRPVDPATVTSETIKEIQGIISNLARSFGLSVTADNIPNNPPNDPPNDPPNNSEPTVTDADAEISNVAAGHPLLIDANAETNPPGIRSVYEDDGTVD